MKRPVKIVIIGAGSINFGVCILNDLVTSRELDSEQVAVVLVDIHAENLAKAYRYAQRAGAFTGSHLRFSATTDRRQALAGADYVLISVAIDRWRSWEQDYRVARELGINHILGENGGPGALFHALRNFELVIPICRDIEQLCPDAWVFNFTNPEARILAAITTLTRVKAIGLCHGFHRLHHLVAKLLSRPLDQLDIRTAGMNHLYWLRQVQDRQGHDLRPELERRIAAEPQCLPPLARYLFQVFGALSMPDDHHIGEYVSFAHEFVEPGWIYGVEGLDPRRAVEEEILAGFRDIFEGKVALSAETVRTSTELAIPIICDLELDRHVLRPAVNLRNAAGSISNLPEDAIIEVPAHCDAAGIHPLAVGALSEVEAALIRPQLSIQKLLVEAYRTRDRRLLLQALLLDPTVQSAKAVERLLDHMFRLQADRLPAFPA